jgi:NADH dehydrogenase (ubiquinone) 1 beta subcomplex subunit 9
MLIHHPTQLIIEETESLLEKWKHPDPYKAPTAPGGSKWERNLPVPSTEGELYCLRIA